MWICTAQTSSSYNYSTPPPASSKPAAATSIDLTPPEYDTDINRAPAPVSSLTPVPSQYPFVALKTKVEPGIIPGINMESLIFNYLSIIILSR